MTMKVLWICNMPLPGACEAFQIKSGMGGGWLYAEAKRLASDPQIDLHVCFADRKNRVVRKAYDGEMFHYAVPRRIPSLFVYDKSMEKHFDHIIKDVNPDVIHIHGTENTTGLAAMCAHPEIPYVVSLQGMLTYIVYHECSGIPFWARWAWGPITFIKRRSAGIMRRRHLTGSKNEIKMLKGASYILGRTNFDKTFAKNICPNTKYVVNQEYLRDVFYQAKWDYQECNKHVILVGGAGPLKGLHIALQAMPDILKIYPDAQLRVVGVTPFKLSAAGILNISGYQLYVHHLIKKFELSNHVCFLGQLDAARMCEEMKMAHVFALTSSCDNSPNMLGEAMMVGTPCVASYVGGVPDMVEHRKNGILYQHDAPYMLASAVKEIFSDEHLAQNLSLFARERSNILFKDSNIQQLKTVYNQICRN